MNARQLAEIVYRIVNSEESPVGDVLWDGTNACELFNPWWVEDGQSRRQYVCNANAPVPVIEAVINQMLGDITDPSVGGTRQHTESVNNFALPVGEYVGFTVDGVYAKDNSPAILLLIPMRQSEVIIR